MVVDNGTAQTVAWTMPGPLMASISMMLAHARAPTPEHSMSLCGTLAQFKGIGEAEKQVVLLWELGTTQTRATLCRLRSVGPLSAQMRVPSSVRAAIS
jgi:hypothetical protein